MLARTRLRGSISSSGRNSAASPRSSESAACADSFITSPSWPVIVSLPVPGIAVASMNRTSPPTGVQARPVATPGRLRPPPRLGEDEAAAEQLAGELRRDRDRLRSSRPRRSARASLRQTVPIWRSRLRTPASRVYSSMIARSAGVGERGLGRLQPVLADLARDQVAAGDVELLVDRVAGELDHLHPVAERRRDRVEDVRGGDEDDLGEVEVEVEVVVAEASRSGPGRGPRASRWPDRRGSRRPSCRSRRS